MMGYPNWENYTAPGDSGGGSAAPVSSAANNSVVFPTVGSVSSLGENPLFLIGGMLLLAVVVVLVLVMKK